jgi:hypothetical protein
MLIKLKFMEEYGAGCCVLYIININTRIEGLKIAKIKDTEINCSV